MAHFIRPGILDRMWHGYFVSGIFEDWALPEPHDLQAAIVELGLHRPELRLGLALTDDGRWLHDIGLLPGLAAEMVSAGRGQGDPTAVVLEAMAHRFDTRPGPRPWLRMDLSNHRLSYSVEHEFLDGGSVARTLAGLCDYARTGSLPPWMEGPFVAHPLRDALRNSLNSKKKLKELWDARAESRRYAAPPGPIGPVETRPAPGLLVIELEAAGRQAVREWRRRHGSGVSDAILTLVLIRNALRRVGLVQDPSVGMVVDLRRYLPRAQHGQVHGNFISGLQVHLPFPESPLQLQERLAAVLGSSRPLAAFAASAAKANLARTSTTEGEQRIPGHPFSHVYMGSRVGGSTGEAMPWTGDTRRMLSWTNPPGLSGITAVVTHLGGGWQFNLSYYSPWTDAGLLREAGHLVTEDPLDLLGLS